MEDEPEVATESPSGSSDGFPSDGSTHVTRITIHRQKKGGGKKRSRKKSKKGAKRFSRRR